MTTPETKPMVAGDRPPHNFSAFQDETLAGLQLSRATAWAIVAIFARQLGAKADSSHPFLDVARAALRAASDRAHAALSMSTADSGAHPHEYAPMLALCRIFAADDPALASGWNDDTTPAMSEPAHYAHDPVLADTMRSLAALDRARPDPALARRHIEARLIRADGRAVDLDDLRQLTPNLHEADFRRIVGALRDAGLVTIIEYDLSTYGKRHIKRLLAATTLLLFRDEALSPVP